MPSKLDLDTQEDAGVSALQNWKVFTRDVISLSVLRGMLNTDSEAFLIPKKQEREVTRSASAECELAGSNLLGDY